MLKKLTSENILYAIFVSLLAYMPFHLFLSRWLSLYTGGLGQWDAGKDIVTVIGLGLAGLIALRQGLYKDRYFKWILILSTVYGLLHLLYYALNREDLHTRSFIIGTLYNCRLVVYLFIGMVVTRTRKVDLRVILKIVLIASTITCLFALMQYVLPKELMTHFGYSIERGAKPSFFIDDKPDFPRVMSTIRDPNSYGAYLILPLMILWGWWNKGLTKRNRLLITGLGLLHGLALLLTFSRGAWLGAVLAAALVAYFRHGQTIIRNIKKHLLVAVACLALLLAGGLYFRNTYVFKNVVLHSDESTVMADPNELRLQLQEQAVDAIADEPVGRGPGTAGLVSIGNEKGTFLPENYYLQIAYEVGLFGLVLFVGILATTYLRLWRRVDDGVNLRVAILASFWGYAFISTLIHLWSNEAVAAQWWLLAGLLTGAVADNQRAILTKRS